MGRFLTARAARRLAGAAAIAVALLAAAEAGLRAAGIGAPVWYHPDPLLGWTLRPYAGSHGGAPYAAVNGLGQRDARHEIDKRAGIYRIAVLGDERSEALGLRLRDTWWQQLAPRLDACGFAAGKKVVTLNFAVGGYSTAQESLVLETSVMRYRPDLVLLQFSTGKDVRENSRALATRLDRPFYAFDEQGRLRVDVSFLKRRDFDRRSQFRYELAREISDRSRLLQLLTGVHPISGAHAGARSSLAGLEPPADARWDAAWRVTEALFERMSEFSARNGARFAIVGAPAAQQLERKAQYPDARLAAFGKSRGIPYIALTPAMTRNVREFYAADGAWTIAGQRAAAEGVAAALCAVAAPATPQRGR